MSMNERAEILFKTLMERYIADGKPVGSRALARESGLDISPATVRNVMADLEELGLIGSPHTSAGRVPTERGYRFFVDSLVTVKDFDEQAEQTIGDKLARDEDPRQMLRSASSLLSEITRFAGIVMIPKHRHTVLKQLEFISLSDNRILGILVTDDGQVHNRVIVTERRLSVSELVEAANYFNETYAAVPLDEVKHRLLRELEHDSEAMHRIMKTAVEVARKVFDGDDEEQDDLVVSGESNLFDVPELSDVEKLRGLFEAFKTKQDLLHLLDVSMKGGGVQIFIGRESGYDALNGCSVVAAPYEVDGSVVGTLGVVGPTRMPYQNVIPIVDITARLLGAALRA